jgi:hypothetical protein
MPDIGNNISISQTPSIQAPRINLNVNSDTNNRIEPVVDTVDPYVPVVTDSSTIHELEKTLNASQLRAFSELEQSEKIKIAKMNEEERINEIEKHIKTPSILEPDLVPEPDLKNSYDGDSKVLDESINNNNNNSNNDNIKTISINSDMLITK